MPTVSERLRLSGRGATRRTRRSRLGMSALIATACLARDLIRLITCGMRAAHSAWPVEVRPPRRRERRGVALSAAAAASSAS